VVLDADEDAELFRVLDTTPEVVGHPGGHFVPGVARGHRSGEDAEHRRAHPGGALDPLLDMPDVRGSLRLVRRGEVVAYARPADLDAELERPALEIIDELVRRHLGIAREKVPRRVECVEVHLGAEFEQIDEGDSLRPPLELVVECLVE
jgi:hypothetical protein